LSNISHQSEPRVNLRPPEPYNPQYYDIPKNSTATATAAKNTTAKANLTLSQLPS